jgi:hypothetical protein
MRSESLVIAQAALAQRSIERVVFEVRTEIAAVCQ